MLYDVKANENDALYI